MFTSRQFFNVNALLFLNKKNRFVVKTSQHKHQFRCRRGSSFVQCVTRITELLLSSTVQDAVQERVFCGSRRGLLSLLHGWGGSQICRRILKIPQLLQGSERNFEIVRLKFEFLAYCAMTDRTVDFVGSRLCFFLGLARFV